MVGYKTMLRNNIPKTLNLALLWCKSKEKWINHVYDNFIKIYINKEDRKRTTQIIIKEQNFNSTIDWENLNEEETEFWKYVLSWVNWFDKNLENITNADISFLSLEEQKMFKEFILKF